MKIDLVKQSKKKQKDKNPKINPKEVAEKDSEETVLLQDSEETFTDKEQTTHQNQQNIQSYKAQSGSKLSQNERFQEIISVSSDSEKKQPEPKRSEKELWKFRHPKKSNKYVPETREDVENKDNEQWLNIRYLLNLRKMHMLF